MVPLYVIVHGPVTRPKFMDLPRYFVVGARPVKLVETADGGMDVLVYDWPSGEFHRDLSYLTRALCPEFQDADTEEVSEFEFEQAVASLRRKRR